MSKGTTPGFAGIAGIVSAVIGVAAVITFVTGSFIHWPFIAGGIALGLLAVHSVNK